MQRYIQKKKTLIHGGVQDSVALIRGEMDALREKQDEIRAAQAGPAHAPVEVPHAYIHKFSFANKGQATHLHHQVAVIMAGLADILGLFWTVMLLLLTFVLRTNVPLWFSLAVFVVTNLISVGATFMLDSDIKISLLSNALSLIFDVAGMFGVGWRVFFFTLSKCCTYVMLRYLGDGIYSRSWLAHQYSFEDFTDNVVNTDDRPLVYRKTDVIQDLTLRSVLTVRYKLRLAYMQLTPQQVHEALVKYDMMLSLYPYWSTFAYKVQVWLLVTPMIWLNRVRDIPSDFFNAPVKHRTIKETIRRVTVYPNMIDMLLLTYGKNSDAILANGGSYLRKNIGQMFTDAADVGPSIEVAVVLAAANAKKLQEDVGALNWQEHLPGGAIL